MRKVCPKMVPKLLTPKQKESRMNIFADILNIIDTDSALLDTVALKGTRFESVEAVKAKATEVLNQLTEADFQHCFQQWRSRMERCRYRQGEYIEGEKIATRFLKQSHVFLVHVPFRGEEVYCDILRRFSGMLIFVGYQFRRRFNFNGLIFPSHNDVIINMRKPELKVYSVLRFNFFSITFRRPIVQPEAFVRNEDTHITT
ncbi:hypothetical protein NQ318_019342 [Aromia moschata]|uniref:Uncharacterized protein n=1 Tax=Aromia moschata TaxID=1265417 RepID=A0AAV8Y9Z3_9CUCU|nr:hypothetical protein NQ318_019342 [Aromia moschata]